MALEMSHRQSSTLGNSYTQRDRGNELALTEEWLRNEFLVLVIVVLFKIFLWNNLRLTEELKKKSIAFPYILPPISSMLTFYVTIEH